MVAYLTPYTRWEVQMLSVAVKWGVVERNERYSPRLRCKKVQKRARDRKKGIPLHGWRTVGETSLCFIADLSPGQSQSVNVMAISADLKADGGFSSHHAFPLSGRRDRLTRPLFLLSDLWPCSQRLIFSFLNHPARLSSSTTRRGQGKKSLSVLPGEWGVVRWGW